jgi:hypothetical protein
VEKKKSTSQVRKKIDVNSPQLERKKEERKRNKWKDSNKKIDIAVAVCSESFNTWEQSRLLGGRARMRGCARKNA